MSSSAPTRRRLALGSALVTAGLLATGAVTALAATPSPSAQPADRKAEQAEHKAVRKAPVTGPAFVCDPALSHGQNVSAYARSLPKGPGRGRLVSQAARSDCGKPSSDD